MERASNTGQARVSQTPKRKLSEVLEQQRQGLELTGAADRLTVGRWMDQWLHEVADERREPTTYLQYETAVRLHIKPFLGRYRLRELNVQHVQDWLKRLREVCGGCNQELAAIEAGRTHTPGCRLKRPAPRGARTRQVALARLRTALAGAQRLQKLPGDFNPARLAEMPSSNSQNRKRKAPTLEEVDHLLKVLNGERMIQSCAYSGVPDFGARSCWVWNGRMWTSTERHHV